MGFLGSLFGTDKARDDTIRYSNQAGQQITSGQQAALGNLGQGYNTAQGYLQPFLQGGTQGYNAYLAGLGLEGPGAQSAVSGAYMNSPIQQQIRDLTMQGINRAYAPTGQGGAATQAATNALLQNWNNYLGQLGGVAQQGVGTGTQASGLGYQYGSDTAGLNFGASQLQANRLMGTGNAVANYDTMPATMGMNFLGSILGSAARAYNPGGGR